MPASFLSSSADGWRISAVSTRSEKLFILSTANGFAFSPIPHSTATFAKLFSGFGTEVTIIRFSFALVSAT